MRKIKIVGFLIVVFVGMLVAIFAYAHYKNHTFNDEITSLNRQKDFTQGISKVIFYMYKENEYSLDELDSMVGTFLDHINKEEQKVDVNEKIVRLWNKFYLLVDRFKNSYKSPSPYTSISLQKNIRDIYHTNLELIVEFEKLIKQKQIEYEFEQNIFKVLEYVIFIILTMLFLYLFTQLRGLLEFVQKFLSTSKKVISSSSIKELEPIEIVQVNIETAQAQVNFNTMLKNIDNSIEQYSKSIDKANDLLVHLETDIQNLMDFMYELSNTPRDKEMIQKEDALIHSLEELNICKKRVEYLKNDLKKLTNKNNI